MTDDQKNLVTAIADMKETEAIELVRKLIADDVAPLDILASCRAAMDIVGARFEAEEYFIPELVLAGEMLDQIGSIVKPLIKEQAGPATETAGKVLIGTVAGDLHDIGKNIVTFMLDVNGFEVIDLGVDVPKEKFVEAIKTHEPQVAGLSGFLTLAFDSMKDTVEAIEAAGLRDQLKISIGGGQVDEQVRGYTGADAFGLTAMDAVAQCKEWISSMTTMTIEREQKSAEDLYTEREKRMADAIALREPDRVPFSFFTHFWTATYCGHTFEELMYDGEKYTSSLRKALNDLQPDAFAALHINIVIGETMEIMGYKQLEWPGHGTDPNVGYQYIDKEYMKPEEYDDYLFDPTGFFLRTYLPRVATAYEAFAKLPDFPTLYYLKLIRATGAFARPELIEAFQTLAEAGRPMEAMMDELKKFAVEAKDAGFPQSIGSGAAAPFDHFADYLRGSKGAMLDMFRHRDKLLKSMDKAAVLIARDAVRAGKANPFCKQVFIPLHWGLDGFMSPEQFETFFWPPLRKVMMTLIENGLNPQVLWEGDCESRLETIADVPPGTCVYWFERTDMAKAKAVLGDVVCLRGNVPPSVLNLGTPDDTDEYVKNLIKVAGKGGGLIVDGALGIPDEAKPENVFAMAKAVRKYGAYG